MAFIVSIALKTHIIGLTTTVSNGSRRNTRVVRGRGRNRPHTARQDFDDNSCLEGAVIGAVGGGALGGTLATKDNWIWSIPTGIIAGTMVGCQIDGG